MSERSTRTHRLREVLLNAGAMLGVVSILLAVAGMFFAITPLVFRSGSMSPAVHTGDLGIAQTVPAADLRVGDIVSVPTRRGVRVTHRIVELDQNDDGAVLVLQGDANDEPDPEQYSATEAERLLFAIPYAGYVASWLSGPGGVFLGGLLVGLVLLVMLRRPSRRPPQGRRRADASRTSVLILGAALVAVPLVAHLPQSVGTLAAWNDSVDVTGTDLTGYTVPAPAISGCNPTVPGLTGTIRHVTYSWPGVTLPATAYTVDVSGITTTGVTPAGTTTKTVDIAYDTANSEGNRNKIATVTITPAVVGPWTGPVDLGKFRTSGNSGAAACGEADPPGVAFLAPDATTRSIAAERTFINAQCGNTNRIACGTYVDASTVTVTYTLKRVRTAGGAVDCWQGVWTTASGGQCTAPQTAATETVGGVKRWFEQANQGTVYTTLLGAGAATYTLTVTITDSWANVTTQVQTFTLT